jgi:hypothetical protein
MHFVSGLLAVITEMAVELKQANKLDDQMLDHIEQRAIQRLKGQGFDSEAPVEESEQVRLVNISLDGMRFALVLAKAIRDNGTPV